MALRRGDRITMAADEVVVVTGSGVPVVRPEIQLLYIATSTDPKNEHDFQRA